MSEKGSKVWSIFVKVIKLLCGFIGIHNAVIGTKDSISNKDENK